MSKNGRLIGGTCVGGGTGDGRWIHGAAAVPPGLCSAGSLPRPVGRVGSAGGSSSSLGLGSSGLPIPRCMSASSITSMELSADVRVAAIVHGNADQCYAGRSYTVDLCSCNKTRYRSLTQDDCL